MVFGLNVVNWVSVEQCAQILIVVCLTTFLFGAFFTVTADHHLRQMFLSINNVVIQLIIGLVITFFTWFLYPLILECFTVTDWRHNYGDFLLCWILGCFAMWSGWTRSYFETYKSDYAKQIYKKKAKDPPEGCERFARSAMILL